jgi:hypothetical protein
VVQKNLGQKVLQRAVEKYGEAEAAARLQVSESVLRQHLNGEKHVPEALLLRAVDLVVDGEPGPLKSS